MTADQPSLMEFVHALLADTHLRGLFAEDPRGTLSAHGLGDLSPADVHDALDLVQDNEITDFHTAQPSWDVDPEAFGHGGTGGVVDPAFDTADTAWLGGAAGHWPGDTAWSDTAWSDTAGSDTGYGAGHDVDLDAGPAGADHPATDLHQH